jgi:signal transduction histidine kinase/HAMP domain-containing protein
MAHRAAHRPAAARGPRDSGRLGSQGGKAQAGTCAEEPTPGSLTQVPAATQGEAVTGQPSLSSLQMRGGLGKTLLIAFLLLAIVPLSFLAFVTYHQVQRDIQTRLLASLETIVSLQEAHLLDWAEDNHQDMAQVALALDQSAPAHPAQGTGNAMPGGRVAEPLQAVLEGQLPALQPAYSALILVDASTGQVLAATDPDLAGEAAAWDGRSASSLAPQLLSGRGLVVTSLQEGEPVPAAGAAYPVVRYPWDGKLLVGVLNWEELRDVVAGPALGTEGLALSLVTADGLVLSASEGRSAQTPLRETTALLGAAAGGPGQETRAGGMQALLQRRSGAGAYQNLQGVPVFGAYRWLPELELGILAEEAQARCLSGGDAVTALIVGATLAVALITAAIAAIVTRRITRPIVQLTATASWMARGDLSHRVSVTRRDEIGVLAGAFNRMAAELQILYSNLEARVAERTAQLAEANEQARYHARQLAISAEVARVASSIRDLPTLLGTVVELISRSFELDQVAIYLLEQEVSTVPDMEGLDLGERHGASPGVDSCPAQPLAMWQAQVSAQVAQQRAPAGSVPGSVRAALSGAGEAGAGQQEDVAPFLLVPWDARSEGRIPAAASPPAGRAEMAIPLQVCGRTLGVLHVTGSSATSFGESEGVVYRSLADQIAIAIENASAYALEHETVRRLKELDRIQSQFLTNMSHALRTPLNSIIGFSRVMLKGLDGSLNELQRSDLTTIHEGGRQLLGLIDDLLELSQWDISPVDPDQTYIQDGSQDAAFRVGQLPALSDSLVPGMTECQVDLGEIVEGVMATARALARGEPIRLTQEVPDDLPRITTDARLVRRLILALLANAIKFTGQGEIRLRVDALWDSVQVSISATTEEPASAGSGPSTAAEQGRARGCHGPGEAGTKARPPYAWTAQPQVTMARPIVEKLGGQIRDGSCPAEMPGRQGGQEEDGATFAFSLPIARQDTSAWASSSSKEAQ